MKQSTQQQIALRCIFGYSHDVHERYSPAQTLLSHAPLGFIFFRDAFDDCDSLKDVHALTQGLITTYPQGLRPVLGLDQEGGQVERLPSWLFPGMLSPHAVGDTTIHESSQDFAVRHYELMAKGLAQLGFTLNFFPTVDAHLNPDNPIIGNRAFSHDPEHVARMGMDAIRAQHLHGVQSVLKHYPGHGNGVVDSHLALPELNYTPAEEQAFIDCFGMPTSGRLPWVMVAHGVYPDLQTKKNIPASCDYDVVTKRLRNHLGFEGIVITDDLDMRGVMDAFEDNLLDACIAAMNAGVDVLLFRGSGERELNLFNALCEAYESGRIDESLHEASINRINEYREEYTSPQLYVTPLETLQKTLFDEAQTLHEDAMSFVAMNSPPLESFGRICLLQPEDGFLPHYDMDRAHGHRFEDVMNEQCPDLNIHSCVYNDNAFQYPPTSDNEIIIAVVWLPKLGKSLLTSLKELTNTPVLILNIGAPVHASQYPEHMQIVNLSGWRPMQQVALAKALKK